MRPERLLAFKHHNILKKSNNFRYERSFGWFCLYLSGIHNLFKIWCFEEIWIFWNRIEMVGVPPVTANALKFLLSTMQRSNEVRNLRYDSIKSGESVWQMERHETKNRTMHRVPLNRYTISSLVHPLQTFPPLKNWEHDLYRLAYSRLSIIMVIESVTDYYCSHFI